MITFDVIRGTGETVLERQELEGAWDRDSARVALAAEAALYPPTLYLITRRESGVGGVMFQGSTPARILVGGAW